MSKRIDIDDAAASDIFGVDVKSRAPRPTDDDRVRVRFVEPKDGGRSAKTEVSPVYQDRSEAWIRLARWRQEHPLQVLAVMLTVGVSVGGVAVALLAPGDGPSPAPPAPRPDGHPQSPTGWAVGPLGTLEVDTRRTWHGRPMPAQLRAGPSRDTRRLQEVPQGTIVGVLDRREVAGAMWYNVRIADGHDGWIHSEVLK